jgi:hypothetical protein
MSFSPAQIITFAEPELLLSKGMPNMTTTFDSNNLGASGDSGPRTTQVHFLEPTPPGFEPEIDYLSTLKAVSEEALLNTAMWPILLQEIDGNQSQWRRTPRACIIDGTGSTDCLVEPPQTSPATKEKMVTWMYREIGAIRQTMKNEAQQGTRVLVAETHHPLALQVLCAAFDLDPIFVLYQMDRILEPRLDLPHMTPLSKAFSTRVTDSRNSDHDHHHTRAAAREQLDSFHIRGQAAYGRDQHGIPAEFASPSCISCCRVSTYGCTFFLRRT